MTASIDPKPDTELGKPAGASSQQSSLDHIPSMDIENRKLQLERERFEEEKKANERTHSLQLEELGKTSPTMVAVVGGLAAVFVGLLTAGANVGVSYYNGVTQRTADQLKHESEMKTEAYKAEANRILEAVKLGDPDRAACTLAFFMDAGLIQTEQLRQFIDAYLAGRPGGSGVGFADAQAPGSPQASSVETSQRKTTATLRPGCRTAPKTEASKETREQKGVDEWFKWSKPSTKPGKSGATPDDAVDAKPALLSTLPFETGWMGGGHNQNEACSQGIAEFQQKFPGKKLERLASGEEQREAGGLFHQPEYKYHCTIGVYATPPINK